MGLNLRGSRSLKAEMEGGEREGPTPDLLGAFKVASRWELSSCTEGRSRCPLQARETHSPGSEPPPPNPVTSAPRDLAHKD